MTLFPYSEFTTSRDAAFEVDAKKAAIDRVRIFKFIRSRRDTGATDEEMGEVLALEGNTVRPRRQELEKAGYIAKSGYRRKTKRNRDAAIWVSICDEDPDLTKFDERRRKTEIVDVAKGELPSVDLAAGAVRLRIGLSHLKKLVEGIKDKDSELSEGLNHIIGELERRRPSERPSDWFSFLQGDV